MKQAAKYLLMILLVAVPFSAFAQDELTFITIPDFPPYAWKQDGKSLGIDVEIIQALAQRTGVKISLSFFPPNRLIRMTKNGEADGSFAAFKTQKREEFAQFVEPPLHYSTYLIFVKNGNEFSFETVQDLAGKTIGKNRGFHISKAFSNAEEDNLFKVIEVNTMEQNIKMLDRGRTDVLVGNEQEVQFFLKQLGLSDKIKSLTQPILKPRGAYLMLSKASGITKNKELISKLSQELQDMKADRTFEVIYEKYVK
ncbi:MAG: transporter substrate-binding domain-containing protein [Rhodospirillales bacterium]|nr:transporter substrate-binding domain-containing protein [Rhodospirillales bacterium]